MTTLFSTEDEFRALVGSYEDPGGCPTLDDVTRALFQVKADENARALNLEGYDRVQKLTVAHRRGAPADDWEIVLAGPVEQVKE